MCVGRDRGIVRGWCVEVFGMVWGVCFDRIRKTVQYSNRRDVVLFFEEVSIVSSSYN